MNNILPTTELQIEELLRGSAPDLPHTLKKRTLNGCTVRIEHRRKRHDRLHWQLTWVVGAILALQAFAVFLVDAQNTRLISGNSQPVPYAPITIAEVTALYQQRARQLALMSASTKIG